MNAVEMQTWAEAMNTAGSQTSNVNDILDDAKRYVTPSSPGYARIEDAQRGLTTLGLALQRIEDIRKTQTVTNTIKDTTVVGDVSQGSTSSVADLAKLSGRALFLIYQMGTSRGSANQSAIETELLSLLGGRTMTDRYINAYGENGPWYVGPLHQVAEWQATGQVDAMLAKYPTPQAWLAASNDATVLPTNWSDVFLLIGVQR